MFRTYIGFQTQVGGLAPHTAKYAGFSSRRALWTALLVSGGMAGLAGAIEVAGPIGQLTPYVPAGWVRRDHRGLCWAPSGRYRVLGGADEHVLHRR